MADDKTTPDSPKEKSWYRKALDFTYGVKDAAYTVGGVVTKSTIGVDLGPVGRTYDATIEKPATLWLTNKWAGLVARVTGSKTMRDISDDLKGAFEDNKTNPNNLFGTSSTEQKGLKATEVASSVTQAVSAIRSGNVGKVDPKAVAIAAGQEVHKILKENKITSSDTAKKLATHVAEVTYDIVEDGKLNPKRLERLKDTAKEILQKNGLKPEQAEAVIKKAVEYTKGYLGEPEEKGTNPNKAIPQR